MGLNLLSQGPYSKRLGQDLSSLRIKAGTRYGKKEKPNSPILVPFTAPQNEGNQRTVELSVQFLFFKILFDTQRESE